ncbi:MAG: Gfo/Idh/MocA family oxidoreductase [Alphaproteobacteria bacterium]|nr:Gfo/Idh/MocA family oxidoreductase [Alphaproteobacteria bacterium]
MTAAWPVPADGWRVGIVGCGIAGRARARALAEVDGARLVAVHRGRFAGELGVPELDADALLAAVDVVVVASPDASHRDWVRRALSAGRHVIVEYPLARAPEQAGALFAAADAAGRLLHVEHIELLSPTTRWLADAVSTSGWRQAALSWTWPGPPWADGADHAWHQLARMHRVVAALGMPARVDVDVATSDRIAATLAWADGRTCTWSSAVGDARALRLTVQTDAGEHAIVDRRATRDGVDVDLPGVALFAEDTRIALARLGGVHDGYTTPERLVDVLRLVSNLGSPGRSEVSANRR